MREHERRAESPSTPMRVRVIASAQVLDDVERALATSEWSVVRSTESGLEPDAVLRDVTEPAPDNHTEHGDGAPVVAITDRVEMHHDGPGARAWADRIPRASLSDGHSLVRALTGAAQAHRLRESLRDARAESDRFATILAHSADAVLVVDNEGVVHYANPAAENLFGRKGMSVVGNVFAHPLGSLAPIDLDVSDTLGHAHVVEMRVCETNWAGTPAHVASFRDVTVRRDTEMALKAAVAELRAKNQDLDLTAHAFSHDLRAPLLTASGFAAMVAEAIQRGELDQTQEDVERVRDAIDRAGEMLSGLLSLFQTGQMDGEPREVEPARVAQDVLHDLAVPIAAAGVEVRVQPDMPEIRTRGRFVHQAMQNLIGNAIKHGCTNPSPVIEISADEDEFETRLCIRDNGEGIPPEHRNHLFEPFHQLDTEVDGIGIGLTIVRRIAELHGGSAWIEPAPGGGTMVWVTFRKDMNPMPAAVAHHP